MPAKGKYFFNESDECRISDPLYEKYRYTSQQHPLLLLLLFIAILFWTTLIIIYFVTAVSKLLLHVFIVFRDDKESLWQHTKHFWLYCVLSCMVSKLRCWKKSSNCACNTVYIFEGMGREEMVVRHMCSYYNDCSFLSIC